MIIRKPVRPGQVQKFPFVVGSEGGQYSEMVKRLLYKAGLRNYNIGLRVGNTAGIKEVLRTGFGIGVLPYFSVERDISEEGLTEIKVRGISLAANIMLIERPRSRYPPAVKLVKELLEDNLRKGYQGGPISSQDAIKRRFN